MSKILPHILWLILSWFNYAIYYVFKWFFFADFSKNKRLHATESSELFMMLNSWSCHAQIHSGDSDSLQRISENHKVLKSRNHRNCVSNYGFFPGPQSAVMLVSKQPVRDPIMGIRNQDRDVFVMVNYDFEYITEEGKEIWMKEGEILLLLSKTNGDWWQVISWYEIYSISNKKWSESQFLDDLSR